MTDDVSAIRSRAPPSEPGAPSRADSGDLCPYGCYWECEHRALSTEPAAEGAPSLRPVHDEQGRALNRCRECGDFFYGVLEHSREHARKRQLGWLPDRTPEGWPR